jgi:hypothetical protein
MRKMLSAALLMCTVALLSVLLIPTVLAKKPTYVSGYMTYTPAIVSARWAGRNLLLDTTEEGVWYGGLVGLSHDEPCRVVIHDANGLPATDWKFRWYTSIVTFEECTVAGKTGGLVMRMVGKSGGPGEEWSGHWVILKGTGGLDGIHGQGTWWGLGFPIGDIPYEGWIHFAPD